MISRSFASARKNLEESFRDPETSEHSQRIIVCGDVTDATTRLEMNDTTKSPNR